MAQQDRKHNCVPPLGITDLGSWYINIYLLLNSFEVRVISMQITPQNETKQQVSFSEAIHNEDPI